MNDIAELVDSLLAGRLAPERWQEAAAALDRVATAAATGDAAAVEECELVLSRLEFEGRVRTRLDNRNRTIEPTRRAGGRSVLLPVGLLCGGLLAVVIGLIGGPRMLGAGLLVALAIPCVAVAGSAMFSRRRRAPASEFRRDELTGPPEAVRAAVERARSALAGL